MKGRAAPAFCAALQIAMQTKLIYPSDTADALREPARCLAAGGLVVFPTETVYGLGADALNEAAVRRIFAAKGRPADNPLIVHIWEVSQLNQLVRDIPPVAHKLMDAFWPGPLTLVMKKSVSVPDSVTAGLDTVAIRMPSHPTARKLLKLANVPVAAPSANTSTRPSPTTAQHVAEDLFGKVDYIIDGGQCEVGLESTVLDVTGAQPVILRPGGISAERLRRVAGKLTADAALTDQNAVPKSPGMKYKHYAPNCPMTVVTGKHIPEAIRQYIAAHPNERIGVLLAQSGEVYYGVQAALNAGGCAADYAHNLFAALRTFDGMGVEHILAEFPFGNRGLEPALRNRIMKSAGGNVIDSNRATNSKK